MCNLGSSPTLRLLPTLPTFPTPLSPSHTREPSIKPSPSADDAAAAAGAADEEDEDATADDNDKDSSPPLVVVRRADGSGLTGGGSESDDAADDACPKVKDEDVDDDDDEGAVANCNEPVEAADVNPARSSANEEDNAAAPAGADNDDVDAAVFRPVRKPPARVPMDPLSGRHACSWGGGDTCAHTQRAEENI